MPVWDEIFHYQMRARCPRSRERAHKKRGISSSARLVSQKAAWNIHSWVLQLERGSLELVFFQLIAEHPFAEAEQPGGLGLIATDLVQGIADHLPLEGGQGLLQRT